MSNLQDTSVLDISGYECLHAALIDFAKAVAESARTFIKEAGIKDPSDQAEVIALHDEASDLILTLVPKLAKLDKKIVFLTAELQGEDGHQILEEFESSYPEFKNQ